MPERVRGLAEHFGKCQAELFAGVETGAEDDFLDWDVGFETHCSLRSGWTGQDMSCGSEPPFFTP